MSKGSGKFEKLASCQHKDNPKANAGLISHLSFGWLNELLRLGYRRPLEKEDLYPLLPEHESERLTAVLEEAWQQELKRTKHGGPSLLKALFSITTASECVFIMILASSRTVCNLLVPVLLTLLLAVLEEDVPGNSYLLYGCGLGISLCTVIMPFVMHHFEYRASMVGMKVMAALTGLLYKKVLRLSRRSCSDVGSGNILNLVSNDINRFNFAVTYLPSVLLAPVEVSFAVGLLAWLLGWPTLLGVVTIAFFTLLQVYCARKIASLREKAVSFSDERVSLTSEVVRGIRLIKMCTWEESYEQCILDARRKERKILNKLKFIFSIFETFPDIGRIVITLSILLSLLVSGHVLAIHEIIFVLCVVQIEEQAVFFYLNRGLHLEAECKASVVRIEKFLLTEELACDLYSPRMLGSSEDTCRNNVNDSPFIDLNNLSCAYKAESQVLSEVTLHFHGREFVGVCGAVGCGKSSLLQAMLKELPVKSGNSSHQGKIAYVPQVPWVFSGTVRENILFYHSLDVERLKTVIEACGLESDIATFPDGDLTVIGENGVVLSGGQRARVSLARAVYADADIYLLDDPLSAVDAKVGRHIFEKCIVGVLKQRLRVLVTHNIQYLQHADRVILLEKGRVAERQAYSDIIQSNDDVISISPSTNFLSLNNKPDTSQTEYPEYPRQATETVTSLVMPEEDRAFGLVSWKTYWCYISAVLPDPLVILLILFLIIASASYSVPELWLSGWSNIKWAQPQDRVKVFVYIGLVCGATLLIYLSTLLVLQTFISSTSAIHRKMVSSLLKCPVLFFDTNPAGRVLNRFSKDIGIMDELLPIRLYGTSSFVVSIAVGFVIPAVASYWVIIAIVPLLAVAVYYGRCYIVISREVARIQALNYSHVLSHFSNTKQGLVSIRAYGAQHQFVKELNRQQDDLTKAWFISLSLTRWLGVRMNAIASMFIIVVLGCCLSVSTAGVGLIGLAVVYGLSSLDAFDYLVRDLAEIENLMTSVERAMAYTQLDSEPGYLKQTRPLVDWPREGQIRFEGVSQVYYQNGPTVLKDVTFRVDARQKIGIAGRTGAGKSSLVAALMRMPESQGRITIDGVDINQINLKASRQVISIIPQDPVLFSGSLRRNIDPLRKSSDADIWQALEDVHLKVLTTNLKNQLDHELTEGGDNFSVGERQLICLARALLQGNKIIVLDEATANVDYKTDHLIQETIREKFKECTVLTIAHRVNTILDYDRVLLLHQGQVVELDEPAVLLNRQDGWFAQLCKSAR